MTILEQKVKEFLETFLGREPTTEEIQQNLENPLIVSKIYNNLNVVSSEIAIGPSDSIQDNLDKLDANGGGILKLNIGTYVLTDNIYVPSGVLMQGASRDGVIIDCNTDYGLKIVGSDSYTTGTVSISTGGATVTGSGTTWVVGMIGQYIFLDGYWYLISDVTSTTSITLDSNYFGGDLSGSSYAIATTNFNGGLKKLTVTNATNGSAVEASYANEPIMDDLIIFGNLVGVEVNYTYALLPLLSCYSNGTNMIMDHSYSFEIRFSAFDDSTSGPGISMSNSGNATIFDTSITGNYENGIELTNVHDLEFISIDNSQNGNNGIELISGNSNIALIGHNPNQNVGSGVKITATSDRTILTNCILNDNGAYGIDISAASCDNTILAGVISTGNTSGSINDLGTGTLKAITVNIL